MSDMKSQKMIIDTDAGVDDAIALMMILADPTVDVLGITTVNGNVGVEQVTVNVGVILDQMGKTAPIFRGSVRPLVAETLDSAHIHGEDGLGGIREQYPPTEQLPEAEAAALALIRIAKEHAGDITILALGPLTNLALAVHLSPEFAGNVSRLVIMGGAIEARGNASPSAEFNILADPEAAKIVFEAGFSDLWLSSWETTLKYPILWDKYKSLTNIKTPHADFFSKMTANLVVFLRDNWGFPGLTIPDPLAAAVALKPEIVTEMVHVPVNIETLGKYGRGLTSVDWYQQFGDTPNAKIVLSLDEGMVEELLRNALA